MAAQLPKISIITPSYNQGAFIERTIQSVLSQEYPNLEYIIMDGGSTDETVSILKKYEGQLIWKSKKDRGQAHAINKGMNVATGEIVAFLNSDDTYQPGTLRQVGEIFAAHPNIHFLYGHGRLIDADDKEIGFYNTLYENHEKLAESCGISQPSAFWRKAIMSTVGDFDESYSYTMDYEYWMRVSAHYPLYWEPKIVANTRIHPDAKTSAFTHALHKEAIRAVKKHYGFVHYDWIFTLTDGACPSPRGTPAYFRYMVFHSLWNYVWYNHRFPVSKSLEIILEWSRKML